MLNSLLGAGCFDKDSNCKIRARSQQCRTNPYSVIKMCPESCGVACSKYFNQAFRASICDSAEKGATKAGKHLANDCVV